MIVGKACVGSSTGEESCHFLLRINHEKSMKRNPISRSEIRVWSIAQRVKG